MSGPDFAGVLAGHQRIEFRDCTCGESLDEGPTRGWHVAHLAAALHDEVARWLADERTREVARRAIATRQSGHAATAALTALAALTHREDTP